MSNHSSSYCTSVIFDLRVRVGLCVWHPGMFAHREKTVHGLAANGTFESRAGAQFTRFTRTKVHILTQLRTLRSGSKNHLQSGKGWVPVLCGALNEPFSYHCMCP